MQKDGVRRRIKAGGFVSVFVKSVWFVVLLFLVGCRGAAREATVPQFAEVPPFGELANRVQAELVVLNEGRRVRQSGVLVLELKLVNVMPKEDAVVYNELASSTLVMIEVLGPEGKYQRSPEHDDLRRGRGGKYHYACLPPGGFVGRRYLIRPSDPWWDLEPGKYRVRIAYRNPFEPCVASPNFSDEDLDRLGKDALVRLLTGGVVSNVEEFEVVADK